MQAAISQLEGERASLGQRLAHADGQLAEVSAECKHLKAGLRAAEAAKAEVEEEMEVMRVRAEQAAAMAMDAKGELGATKATVERETTIRSREKVNPSKMIDTWLE